MNLILSCLSSKQLSFTKSDFKITDAVLGVNFVLQQAAVSAK